MSGMPLANMVSEHPAIPWDSCDVKGHVLLNHNILLWCRLREACPFVRVSIPTIMSLDMWVITITCTGPIWSILISVSPKTVTFCPVTDCKEVKLDFNRGTLSVFEQMCKKRSRRSRVRDAPVSINAVNVVLLQVNLIWGLVVPRAAAISSLNGWDTGESSCDCYGSVIYICLGWYCLN